MKQKLISFLAIFAPVLAHADPINLQHFVYEGTIGKSPIVLETFESKKDKNIFLAQYFYKSKKQSIHLERQKDGSLIEYGDLCVGGTECKDGNKFLPSAKFIIEHSDKGYYGDWRFLNGEKPPLKVDLALVGFQELKVKAFDANEGINQIRLDEENLANDPYLKRQFQTNMKYSKEVKIGNVAYVSATGESGVNFIKITRHPSIAKMNSLNRTLEEYRLKDEFYNQYCINSILLAYGGGLKSGYEEISNDVIYLSEKLLVIGNSGSVDCAGAHPSNFIRTIQFDFDTGKRLSKSKLTNAYQKTPDKYGLYNFTPQFDKFLKSLNPKSKYFMNAEDTYKECWDFDIAMPEIHYEDDGVYLGLESVPHAMSPCLDNYFKIPYRDFATWLTPIGKQYFAKELAN